MVDRMTPVLVRVQGEHLMNGSKPEHVPPGYIDWEEHRTAWEDYTRRYPGQSAQTIADRGGFGWNELCDHLGHPPESWRPRDAERFKNYIPPTGKVM